MAIELHSPGFKDHEAIPSTYSRSGDNVSPPLEWSGVPGEAQELALICEDPDAPGGTFTHWVVTGIDPKSTGVGTGEVPAGSTQHRNDFGDQGWDGPQPPVGHGRHRYYFHLFALNEPLGVRGSEAREIRSAVESNAVADAHLMGTFER